MITAEEKSTGLPRIGDAAPIFDGPTTQGPISLDDFKGNWVVLFSHPSDFTPVCTTEIIALNNLQPEFKKRGVELIGLSIDSVPSHIAWIRNIEEKTGNKITFPIIADSDRYVSTLYGMIHPRQSKTHTVRCVFIIDPGQIVRAMLYYPASIGRNVDEILRIVDSLQTADKHSVSIPANWRPGDPVVIPSPDTQEKAEERMKEDYECIDWYLCKKNLSGNDGNPY